MRYIFLFMLIPIASFGQRFSTGVTLGINTFQRTELPRTIVTPEHSYFVYLAENEEKEDQPIYDQWFNGASLGLNFNLDYKRFMLSTEPRASFLKTVVPMDYPTGLGSLLYGSTIDMQVNRRGYILPVLLKVRLTSRSNGLYLLGGVQWEYHAYRFDRDTESAIWLQMADTEMYGILYNENYYYSILAGLGYKYNDFYTSLRWVHRPENGGITHPEARFTYLEWVINRTLNFQKLRKGHIIYAE